MGEGYWKDQVNEFCGLFGFRLDSAARTYPLGGVSTVFSVKAGRATVAYRDENKTWCSRELPLSTDLDGKATAKKVEKAMESIMKTASGRELIVRGSDEERKTPYGFTKVRLIRHILLPEFGSVEELKLKLAASGEGEP